MCKPNPAMRKLLLVLASLLFCETIHAQYQYRGQVFSAIRQTPITFGEVRLPSPPGTGRRGKPLTKIDSLGFFSFSLKDTTNVQVAIDCMLDGSTLQRLSYSDTTTKIFIQTECSDYNTERAKKDIEKNGPYLLCYLGYASYHFSTKDRTFEKKYGITYYSFADTPIW